MNAHGVTGVEPAAPQPERFPLGSQLEWRSCHGWKDGHTTWVDGWVFDARRCDMEPRPYVDIGAFGDDDVDPQWHTAATAAWQDGRVLAVVPYDTCPNVLALIVPADTLDTSLIVEALRRWRP